MLDLEQAMHAADMAALRASIRSVVANASEVDDVVSLAVTVTLDSPGLLVIEGEFRNKAGQAVGGFAI